MIYVKQNNQTKNTVNTIYVINQSMKKWFWDLAMNISRLLYIIPYTDQSKKHQSLWFITYVLYITWKEKWIREENSHYMVGSWEMRSDKSSKAPFEEKEEEASSVESDESFAEDLESPSTTSSFVVQMRLPSWILIFFPFFFSSMIVIWFSFFKSYTKRKKIKRFIEQWLRTKSWVLVKMFVFRYSKQQN